MNHSAAEILRNTVTPDKFGPALIELEGDFEFDRDSMIDFGGVYCSLYPDSLNHTDSHQVITGYKLVRISLIEILLKDMESSLKPMYREMLISGGGVTQHMPEIISKLGNDRASEIYKSLDSRVKDIKSIIDSLPNSVIKERFTGGISVFYNTLYLMKKSLNI